MCNATLKVRDNTLETCDQLVIQVANLTNCTVAAFAVHSNTSYIMSGVSVGGQFFKYDCQEIDLRLTAKGLTEDDLRELGQALRAGKFRRLKKLNLVSSFCCFVQLCIFVCHRNDIKQGGNGITDKGALVLAEALKFDSGLQLLDLVRGNQSYEYSLNNKQAG
jgi:hypothetical protein